jgi:hypothetical protein
MVMIAGKKTVSPGIDAVNRLGVGFSITHVAQLN